MNDEEVKHLRAQVEFLQKLCLFLMAEKSQPPVAVTKFYPPPIYPNYPAYPTWDPAYPIYLWDNISTDLLCK